MKKTMIFILGAALVGCKSVPEQSQAPEQQARAESAVAETQASPAVTPAQEIQQAAAVAQPAQPAPEPPVQPPVPAEQSAQTLGQAQSAPAAPQEAPAVSQRAMAMDSRMDKVVKLINSSSGARQVLASDNPEAHAYHAEAKALFNQALSATDKAEASRLLNEAVKTMYSAIRAASPASVLAEKKKRDYQKLTRSVNTFLEQQERISEEKGGSDEGDALRGQVRQLVAEADKQYAAGNYDQAQLLLRESFEMLRNSIEGMRGGDTLVRSLNFATKAEEYDYELERFKSQRLLVDVLLEEKRKSSPYVAEQVNKYIDIAEEGRRKAEAEAAAGNHEAGIKHLEDARKYIVRALRTGGIYVPG